MAQNTYEFKLVATHGRMHTFEYFFNGALVDYTRGFGDTAEDALDDAKCSIYGDDGMPLFRFPHVIYHHAHCRHYAAFMQ